MSGAFGGVSRLKSPQDWGGRGVEKTFLQESQ